MLDTPSSHEKEGPEIQLSICEHSQAKKSLSDEQGGPGSPGVDKSPLQNTSGETKAPHAPRADLQERARQLRPARRTPSAKLSPASLETTTLPAAEANGPGLGSEGDTGFTPRERDRAIATRVVGQSIQDSSKSETGPVEWSHSSSVVTLQDPPLSEILPSPAMVPTTLSDEAQMLPGNGKGLHSDNALRCTVGIMAYNEEANIGRTLRAVLNQQVTFLEIEEVIVVASGCTDQTVPIVAALALQEPRIRLCIQEKREGKASAINVFLKQTISPIVIVTGADVIPEDSALEMLCAPFKNPKVGMVGGHPIPVNDPATFMGHTVHLLWRLHDRLARVHPKLGEVIAFRNVIPEIPITSPVDEISIQAFISQLGYQLIYEPSCIVYNKGPLTVRDFLKQRRRIYAGHLQVRVQQHYEASTMRTGPIIRQVIESRDFTLRTPRQTAWTLGAVMLEGLARLQGHYDYRRKRQYHIWQMVNTTKELEAGKDKLRGHCNAQSLIVFRLILEDDEAYDLSPERGDRESSEAAHKILPILRTRLRKEDQLIINGPGIMTATIRADQHGAEQVAKRIQELVQATPVRLGIRGRGARITVAYGILTFPLNGRAGSVTDKSSSLRLTFDSGKRESS